MSCPGSGSRHSLDVWCWNEQMTLNEAQKSARRRRSEERVATSEGVMLSSLERSSIAESTRTQNVSSHGARVITQRIWSLGSVIAIRSLASGLRAEARVVYCRSFSDRRFAIGLKLLSKKGDWPTSGLTE
jgi:hypothetical protein